MLRLCGTNIINIYLQLLHSLFILFLIKLFELICCHHHYFNVLENKVRYLFVQWMIDRHSTVTTGIEVFDDTMKIL